MLAIIGGSGITGLQGLAISKHLRQETPWGDPSSHLATGKLGNTEVLFLPRHGEPHTIPPHKVNYRANIWALKEQGASQVIAINAVGGITSAMQDGCIVIPHQVIDYTWGREHTFFDETSTEVTHIDFTRPYTEKLRQLLLRAGEGMEPPCIDGAVYGATQGPRLETAAEITRMERDGCDVVGMTGMPEAALAREQELDYASICLVVNRAAGKTDDNISMDEIVENLRLASARVNRLLENLVSLLQTGK